MYFNNVSLDFRLGKLISDDGKVLFVWFVR